MRTCNTGLAAGGSSQRKKEKRNHTPTDWFTCAELQSLLGNPAVDALDAKVRQVLQDQDLELDEDVPVSDLFKMLEPESMELLYNTVNDLALQGEFDVVLNAMPAYLSNERGEIAGEDL